MKRQGDFPGYGMCLPGSEKCIDQTPAGTELLRLKELASQAITHVNSGIAWCETIRSP